MRFVLFAFSFLAAPLAFAEGDVDLGIQNCSQVYLNFKEVKQVRSFDKGQVHLYLIDRIVDGVRMNGMAVTYKDFCCYINGIFETDLKEALSLTDIAPAVDRLRLKLLLSKSEGAKLAWLTVQIKKDAQNARSAISGWFR